MIKLIFLVIGMTVFSALGGFFLKKAADTMKGLFSLAVNKNFYIGAVLFSIGSLLNIYGLRYIPYSVILPVKSLSYVWTVVIAYIFLNEKITSSKIIGISSIIIGVIFISL